MPSYTTEGGGALAVERVAAPRKTEEELRQERTQRFVQLLESGPALGTKPEFFDNSAVRSAIGKSDHELDREAAATFAEGFRRMLAAEASKG